MTLLPTLSSLYTGVFRLLCSSLPPPLPPVFQSSPHCAFVKRDPHEGLRSLQWIFIRLHSFSTTETTSLPSFPIAVKTACWYVYSNSPVHAPALIR